MHSEIALATALIPILAVIWWHTVGKRLKRRETFICWGAGTLYWNGQKIGHIDGTTVGIGTYGRSCDWMPDWNPNGGITIDGEIQWFRPPEKP